MGSHTRLGQCSLNLIIFFKAVVQMTFFPPGPLLEVQITFADYNASSASASSTSGKDLHRQVSASF